VNPFKEFATPSERKRWVLVASRIGRFAWVYEAKQFSGTLADYLDPECPEDDIESATPEQVEADAKYNARKAAEGCGFAMTLIDRNSTRVGVIPKSYGKRQCTGTFVRTAKSYRMLRPREIARLHGFKSELFADLPKTTQYELYGQGVVATPFVSLGEAIGRFLQGECVEERGQLELFAS
jgi:site-specific DNA-cytosine methylase